MTIMNGTKKAKSEALQNLDQGGGSKKQGLLPTATGRAQILLWYQNNARGNVNFKMNYGSTVKGRVGTPAGLNIS
jgi:hypothetical protein